MVATVVFIHGMCVRYAFPPGAKPAAPGQVPAPLGFRDAEGRKFPGGAGLAVARGGHLRYPPPGSDTLQGGIRGGEGARARYYACIREIYSRSIPFQVF